jgi:hypothetical protein
MLNDLILLVYFTGEVEQHIVLSAMKSRGDIFTQHFQEYTDVKTMSAVLPTCRK